MEFSRVLDTKRRQNIKVCQESIGFWLSNI